MKIISNLNDQLNNFEFYKLFDSFSCFQEIQMFISGTLPQSSNPMVNLSEIDKAKKKGLDEWSFRNPDPPERKKKKGKKFHRNK